MTAKQRVLKNWPLASAEKGPRGWWRVRLRPDWEVMGMCRRESWAWAEAERVAPEPEGGAER